MIVSGGGANFSYLSQKFENCNRNWKVTTSLLIPLLVATFAIFGLLCAVQKKKYQNRIRAIVEQQNDAGVSML